METNLKKYNKLEKNIGYKFKNINLLESALTHRGYFYSNSKDINHNEKLEFLGDRVLGLIISHHIYKNYEKASVGEMARYFSYIVGSDNLYEIATKIEIKNYVRVNKNQVNDSLTLKKILIDAVEALISAIFLDSSLKDAEKVVLKLFKESFNNIASKIINPKGLIQEFFQKQNKPLPVYEVVGQKGPDHKPVFKVRLKVDGYDIIEIESSNIKHAQKELAEKFIAKYINNLK